VKWGWGPNWLVSGLYDVCVASMRLNENGALVIVFRAVLCVRAIIPSARACVASALHAVMAHALGVSGCVLMFVCGISACRSVSSFVLSVGNVWAICVLCWLGG
jgi:hypothetical protein